jgi:hypothetical protein
MVGNAVDRRRRDEDETGHAGVFVGGVVSDGAGSHCGDVFGVSGRTYRDAIYYQPALMDNLKTLNTPIRKTWKEVTASW